MHDFLRFVSSPAFIVASVGKMEASSMFRNRRIISLHDPSPPIELSSKLTVVDVKAFTEQSVAQKLLITGKINSTTTTR